MQKTVPCASSCSVHHVAMFHQFHHGGLISVDRYSYGTRYV